MNFELNWLEDVLCTVLILQCVFEIHRSCNSPDEYTVSRPISICIWTVTMKKISKCPTPAFSKYPNVFYLLDPKSQVYT